MAITAGWNSARNFGDGVAVRLQTTHRNRTQPANFRPPVPPLSSVARSEQQSRQPSTVPEETGQHCQILTG